MIIHIKNMVCARCKVIVKDELDRLGISYFDVRLGEAVVKEHVEPVKLQALQTALLKSGLEIMDTRKSRLMEKIKSIIIEEVHYAESNITQTLSSYLAEKLHYNYAYLSNLFVATVGSTIEHYYINQKIERVKELLIYDDLSLTQIANEMNYSSPAHLSKQFKNTTGFTASSFRKLKNIRVQLNKKEGKIL